MLVFIICYTARLRHEQKYGKKIFLRMSKVLDIGVPRLAEPQSLEVVVIDTEEAIWIDVWERKDLHKPLHLVEIMDGVVKAVEVQTKEGYRY